ncbi:unnamed protein product [Closterium sp. NIES-53]
MITFIDPATRYVWHLNLPSRDMAFEAFVAWLPVVERESGAKLKSFQSDGGGEYQSQRFRQYLSERGIKRLISLPYAHQQQGVACDCPWYTTARTLQEPEDFPNAHTCDVIFYERLTIQTYLDNLAANRDLTGGFRGNQAFSSAADEADWDKQNVDGASEEAGPLPYCYVNIPMDDDNTRESVNAETYFDFADTGYVTPQPVDTNVSKRIGPDFLPDPEAGDEASYPEDANLPRYTEWIADTRTRHRCPRSSTT